MKSFVKFRFASKHGQTAGLIIEADRFHHLSISDLSRFYPYSEARFMARIEVSPTYPTWETAFDHEFAA
jgi:hypothetical protein